MAGYHISCTDYNTPPESCLAHRRGICLVAKMLKPLESGGETLVIRLRKEKEVDCD